MDQEQSTNPHSEQIAGSAMEVDDVEIDIKRPEGETDNKEDAQNTGTIEIVSISQSAPVVSVSQSVPIISRSHCVSIDSKSNGQVIENHDGKLIQETPVYNEEMNISNTMDVDNHGNAGEEVTETICANQEGESRGQDQGVTSLTNEDDKKNHQVLTKQRKSRLKIVESESEDEENNPVEEARSLEESNEITVKSSRGLLFDSDSDNEESKGPCEGKLSEKGGNLHKNITSLCDPESSEDENDTTVRKPKRPVLFDSEDEGDNPVTPMLECEISSKGELVGNQDDNMKKKLTSLCDPESSDDENDTTVRKPKRPVLFDSEDEGEKSVTPVLEGEISSKGELSNQDDNTKKLSALCDSESSEDEDEKLKAEQEESSASEVVNQELSGGIKKLTPREALEQRKEIQSESQRMTRETNISLPYHIPKQRSLKEFLQKRPKFADSVGIPVQKTPASMSIKLTDKNLDVISKKLEEREKEVEKFFKSDSEESADEDDPDFEITPEIKDKAENEDAPPEPNLEKVTVDNPDSGLSTTENHSPDKSAEVSTSIPDTVMDCDVGEPNEQISNDAVEGVPEELDGNDEMDCSEAVAETMVEEELTAVNNRKKLLLEKIGNIKPRLSGGPNFVIDLEDNTTKPDEVSQLMERFIHHNSRRKSHKNKVQLSIVTVTGAGEIQKEKMSVELDEGASQPTVVETPGEKLQKLRTELQKQIAEQRTKLWEQKMTNKSKEDEEEDEEDDDMDVYKGEKDSCCGNLDNEFDADDETECDKMGTNDVVEDDEEEHEDNVDNNEEDDPNNEDGDEEENDESEESQCESDNDQEDRNNLVTNSAKKRLKRIIVNEDSDDEDEQVIPAGGSNKNGSTDSWEDQPEPGQKSNERTPKRDRMDSKPELGFLSPVYHLTGLQSLNSGSKFLQESPNSPAFQLPPEPSPLKGWQKKLFSDSDLATIENQSDDEADQNQPPSLNPSEQIAPEMPPSTQDLLNLCSGKFTGFTQEETSAKSNDPTEINPINTITSPVNNDNKTDDHLENSLLPNTFQIPKIPTPFQETKEIVDDNDDKLISQILDEDEMEAFKKKFESPVNVASQTNNPMSANIATCINFDSDDESDKDDGVITVKKKKRNLTALIDSDDEADEDADVGGADISDDDQGEEDVVDDEREVDYDSEENEIEVNKTGNPKKLKIKDFFENEAELSESEWGSADEDENNLDEMEIELGDSEKIDENKVRRDLEKIHMRQLLDEDKREVKILQELLLEDGELHGTGRQKQFRWKNIDANGENNDENVPQNENEDCLLEDEDNEEEWRKKRFEREVFLRKNQKEEADQTEAEIDITASSQVLKLGQKFVLKNRVQVDKKISEQVSGLASFAMQTKRGSFLTRTDQVLTRVAEYTKESTKLHSAATSKKHFVFQSVNVDKALEVEKKRKASEVGTPQAIKKMRIDKLSPALQRSGNNRLKKLFTNL